MQQNSTLTRAELREQRLQALLDSCRNQILQQMIGPFGLTPAMFDDKNGGNVTTQHNAEQGRFAKESEEFDRDEDYNYSAARKRKKHESLKNGSMNSQEFIDDYTGKSEPTKRTTSKGKLAMNAELDHLVPMVEAHRQGGWMKDKAGRDKLSSIDENLHYTTFDTNRGEGGKHAQSPEDYLSSESGFDEDRIRPMVEKARKAIGEQMPTSLERLKYHGVELAKEGAKEAGKNALRQAIGIALHTFVNQMFMELKDLFDRPDGSNLVDDLIAAMKRVLERVMAKVRTMLDAGISGAIQGFVSNLLTFLINNFITTSAKIVTAIREGMTSLWQAIKIMVNPPAGMTGLEIAREVSKIIAGIVTTSFGLLFEEAIKAMLTAAVPFLAPLMDIIAPAVTAILVGVVSALMVYGLDRLFDWLSDTGTALLQAMESNLEALSRNIELMAQWVEQQYLSSERYAEIRCEYQLIEIYLAEAEDAQRTIVVGQSAQISSNKRFMGDLRSTMSVSTASEQEAIAMIEAHLAKDTK